MWATFHQQSVLLQKMSEDLLRSMEEYVDELNSWKSSYLWQAMNTTASECREKGIGYNCNHGVYEGGACKCDLLYISQEPPSVAVPSSKDLKDGIRQDCSIRSYTSGWYESLGRSAFVKARIYDGNNKHNTMKTWLRGAPFWNFGITLGSQHQRYSFRLTGTDNGGPCFSACDYDYNDQWTLELPGGFYGASNSDASFYPTRTGLFLVSP
jgi:hypothetical protein